MDRTSITSQYSEFVKDMLSRCDSLGVDLRSYPIDHVCYRAHDMESFKELFEVFKSMSVIYTDKNFHDRKFHSFFLSEPLVAEGVASYIVEFAQPGGSDDYENGFQHFEIATPKKYEDLFEVNDKVKGMLFEGKYGDEKYLKWEDKKALKLKAKPIAYESLAEDNSVVNVVEN